jgi:hypothetical protein
MTGGTRLSPLRPNTQTLRDAQALAQLGLRAETLLAGATASDGLSIDPASALAGVVDRFGLPPLAQDILALVAAPECGPGPAAALALHPLSLRGRATVTLAEEVLGTQAAGFVTQSGLLRQARLAACEPGPGLAQRSLALPEAVAAALRGLPHPDAALWPALTVVSAPDADLPATDAPQIDALCTALLRAPRQRPRPVLQLDLGCGAQAHTIAAGALAALGLAVWQLDPALLPPDLPVPEAAALLTRDLILNGAGVLLPATAAGMALAQRCHGAVIVVGTAVPEDRNSAPLPRPVAGLIVPRGISGPRPSPRDARDIAAMQALGLAPDPVAVARDRAARGLDALAERIEPQATWADLVLPGPQMAQLAGLAAAYRQGTKVLEDWGFRAKSRRGTAIAALFAGPSGTGKTMAAEVLARDLGCGSGALALYRVDLSAMTSKWIGETQKNIGTLFDAAENSGAILLFDEGEALFACRSGEVRDAHDRHANADTAYLLQRLEGFSGIAIITTNLRQAVDDAFLRRFRAVIDFPFPDQAQRAEIWARVFPPGVPCDGVDPVALSRLAIAGGYIRSMALTAAYLAAEEGGPVTMARLERAARMEYAKTGKSPGEAELRGFR